MKKRIIALTLLLALFINVIPSFAEELDFMDVGKEHVAYEAIMYLKQQGVLNGKSETLFYPDDSLKREELAKILAAAFSLTETENAPIFYDVPIGTWYAPYVQKIAASGLVKGISETEFGVDKTLTRQDLAVILKRYLDLKKISTETENSVIYADDNKIADYAREAVLALSACEVMPARENNLWQPQAEATRAETALAVYNALNLGKKQAESLGRYGDISQYDPPYDVPTDDRLAEMMPEPFDATKLPKVEIASEDFEDGDYGKLEKKYMIGPVSQPEDGGIDNSGCIKLDGEGSANFTYTAAPGEFVPGDYLALSVKLKGKDIVLNGNSYYVGILAVHDEYDKWLNEAHEFRQTADTDWIETQQVLMIPEPLNTLTQPDHYVIYINLKMGNMTGTVWFDEVKLYKLKFPPMDTILMEPNYKGVVRGDNGVGDISLRAYIHDLNGMYDLDSFNFTAQITDEDRKVYLKSETEKVSPVMDIHFSSATLPMGGDYWLESIITDKTTGEVVQTQEWTLHKKEADFKMLYDIDEYGRITKNGEAIFPCSTVNYSNYEGIREDIVGNPAIDNIKHNGMGWYYSFSEEENHSLIEALAEHNQTMSLYTGNMAFSNKFEGVILDRVKEQTDLRGLITKLVNNFKEMPNLYTYYVWDEQNAVRYGAEFAWMRAVIESLDLDHPTAATADNTISTRPGVYARTTDLLAYDPYPVTGKPNQDLSLVYKRITEGKKLNPNKPIYTVLQGFWFHTRNGDLRGPTQQEFRNMVFQALCAGTIAFEMYGYRSLMQSPSPGRAPKEEWLEYTEVYSEVQHLEPIILSTLPAPYYEVKGGGDWLNTMSKRHEGKSYLFTVNNQPTEKAASIYLDGVKEIRGMYSKNVYKADENGNFKIDWEGYQTEIFEYEQDDYKSSHAELKNFVTAGVITADSESEVPTIMIPADTNEVEYRAYISDYAELYINDVKVEESGKLDVSGLTEIALRVVSEDGRFTTEKTYKIERS